VYTIVITNLLRNYEILIYVKLNFCLNSLMKISKKNFKKLKKFIKGLNKEVSKLKSEFKKFKPHSQKGKEALTTEVQNQTH
jgi:predicted translin family RNA/ssDNA-binding protein